MKNSQFWLYNSQLQRKKKVEIDRYIGLPIFLQIFKHFTVTGYRYKKKKMFYLSHT